MAKKTQHKETDLVRMLAYALGVAPEEFGLLPDEDGWVPVKELIKALHDEEGWRGVREGMINDAANRIAPDELDLDEGRIRSRTRTPPRPHYGAEPPPHLFIALRPRAWPQLKTRGLAANPAGPVVLCADEDFAHRLGKRRAPDPVMVTVQAHRASDAGVIFSRLGENLYLCDWIPADCLMGPPVDETQKPPPKKKPLPKAKQAVGMMPHPDSMPGSFRVTPRIMRSPIRRRGSKSG